MSLLPAFRRRPAALAVVLALLAVAFAPWTVAQDKPEEPRAVTEPAVQALLDSKFESPLDRLRAVLVMIDLKHGFAARPLVEQLLAAQLAPEQLAALGNRLGTAALVKLSQDRDLAPQGAELAKAILAAQTGAARDPQSIAQLVEQLRTAPPSQHVVLTARLREARSAAVKPLLWAIVDPATGEGAAPLRRALLAIGTDALPPLWGALESPDPNVRLAAIGALGRMRDPQSVVPLLASLHVPDEDLAPDAAPQPGAFQRVAAEREAAAAAIRAIRGQAPSLGEAVELLLARSEQLYAESFAPHAADAAPVEVWDFKLAEPQARMLPPADAALVWAARLARDAEHLAPDDGRARRLSIATRLATDARRPPGEAVDAQAWPYTDQTGLESALLESLKQGAWSTAAQAARHLTDRDALYTSLPEPAPLVLALRHGDERLRFAALETIERLQPTAKFPGSSYVSDALAHFVTAWGERRAVVVDNDLNHAEELRTLVVGAGYDADVTSDVRDLLRVARTNADYELAVIDVSISFPTANDVLAELRRDWRTAQLPVLLVAMPERLEDARRLADRHTLTAAFVRPQDAAGLEFELTQLAALPGARAMTTDERRAAGQAALAMLARLSAAPRTAIALAPAVQAAHEALYRPAVAENAAAVLGRWVTPAAQRALADAASLTALPLELRSAAAEALRWSLAEHGVLLTPSEVQAQYDRYNASEHLDAATQALLASILDTIEARAAVDEDPPAAEGSPPE
ncbi:MAG: HEAT repeat domain-containing protein [Pirellulales bacterium]|nr:HEAT repeat domain-containing protein [Pirellulales bacterium]